MNDATGKSKSQQVIVLENIIGRVETILESFRSREKTITKLCEAVIKIADNNSVQDDQLDEIVNFVKERFPEELKALEEATAVVAAMPALIEGDTGVIEQMMQPAAPLMRRYDGTTIRDRVYEQMMVDRSSGVSQMRNPPQSLGIFTDHGDDVNESVFPRQPVATNEHPGVDTTQVRNDSSSIFVDAIGHHGTDDMIEAVQRDVLDDDEYGITMMDVMTEAIAIYTVSKGRAPSTGSIRGMIDLMEPTTDENMATVGGMIKDLMKDPESIISFFDEDLA